VRWALTAEGVVECPGFPGCSQGFQALESDLEGVTRSANVGRLPSEQSRWQTLYSVCYLASKKTHWLYFALRIPAPAARLHGGR